MLKQLLATVMFGAVATAAGVAAEWSYEDGSGATVTLDEVPTRIVAHANAAAALIPLGIRPVGIYADGPIGEDKSLEGLDLSGIAVVGETWGEIDIEKVAALQPELIVAEWWPLEQTWSGLESGVSAASQQMTKIAPITGPAQGDSIVTLIEDYAELAESLGADLAAPRFGADKAQFELSLERFKAALAAKPGLTALAVWAGTDALYVAAVEGASELGDFARWGLKLISPAVADDRGYWETLSWEQADKYQPDLILVDNRSDATMQTALSQPMWTSIRAAAAGQVADWPAFWLRNYAAYAKALDALTTSIEAADPDIGD